VILQLEQQEMLHDHVLRRVGMLEPEAPQVRRRRAGGCPAIYRANASFTVA
jgi:hypothetical protein